MAGNQSAAAIAQSLRLHGQQSPQCIDPSGNQAVAPPTYTTPTGGCGGYVASGRTTLKTTRNTTASYCDSSDSAGNSGWGGTRVFIACWQPTHDLIADITHKDACWFLHEQSALPPRLSFFF